jgi:hypothetical protein
MHAGRIRSEGLGTNNESILQIDQEIAENRIISLFGAHCIVIRRLLD